MIKIKIRPPDTKKIAKVVITNDQGEVLLLLRQPGEKYAGRWDLPGGHLIQGETWISGGKREVKEETNLDVDNLQFVVGTENSKYYKTNSWSGKIFSSHQLPEHSEYRWFSPSDIGALNMSEKYINAIKKATLDN